MLTVDNVNQVLEDLIDLYGTDIKDDLIRKISNYDLVELVNDLMVDYDIDLIDINF